MWTGGAIALGGSLYVEGRSANSEELHVKYLCPWCDTAPQKLYDIYTHVHDEHNDKFDYKLKDELKRSYNVSVGDEDEID